VNPLSHRSVREDRQCQSVDRRSGRRHRFCRTPAKRNLSARQQTRQACLNALRAETALILDQHHCPVGCESSRQSSPDCKKRTTNLRSREEASTPPSDAAAQSPKARQHQRSERNPVSAAAKQASNLNRVCARRGAKQDLNGRETEVLAGQRDVSATGTRAVNGSVACACV
jgi:hypothetical protein